MKNLIICNCATGLEIFRGMLIQELAKEGNNVYAIVPKLDDKKENDAEERIKKMHCKLIRIPMERRGMNPLKDIALMKAYYKVVRKIQPDLVITYTIKPNIYGDMVCRVLKIPYVVNITGLGTAFQRNGILKQLVINMYKIVFEKYKVPLLDEAYNIAIEAHKFFYNVGAIGWDVAITEEGPIFIERNDNFEITLMQACDRPQKKGMGVTLDCNK